MFAEAPGTETAWTNSVVARVASEAAAMHLLSTMANDLAAASDTSFPLSSGCTANSENFPETSRMTAASDAALGDPSPTAVAVANGRATFFL